MSGTLGCPRGGGATPELVPWVSGKCTAILGAPRLPRWLDWGLWCPLDPHALSCVSLRILPDLSVALSDLPALILGTSHFLCSV